MTLPIFKYTRPHKLLILLAFALVMSGCAQTKLSGPAAGTEFIRLASTGTYPLSFQVIAPSTPLSVGSQYVFVGIPAGNVVLTDPKQAVSNALYRALALHGAVPAISENSPQMTINFVSASVNAFDLLFVRRVRAEVVLNITFPNRAVATFVGRSARYRFSGFAPQLEQRLAEALEDAFSRALSSSSAPRKLRG